MKERSFLLPKHNARLPYGSAGIVLREKEAADEGLSFSPDDGTV